MSPRRPPKSVTARARLRALCGAVTALVACTNAYVEPVPVQSTAVDDHLSLHTKICTAPPDPKGFPVKVLFMVDQSGSMCVSDPPGAQMTPTGICEQYCPVAGVATALNPGCATTNPQPGRVQALHQIIDQFKTQNLAITGGNGPGPISVSIVPFETNVQKVWPDPSLGSAYLDPNDASQDVDSFIDKLQTQLGNGTDDQGVLSYSETQMANDMQTSAVDVLPRTRYIVVWMTDGTPYPRCTATETPDGGLPDQDYHELRSLQPPGAHLGRRPGLVLSRIGGQGR